jgi:basic membrane protein A
MGGSMRFVTTFLAVVALIASVTPGGAYGGAAAPRLIIGAIHVGSITDAGYNQAQHDGLVYLQQQIPGLQILEAENIPEGPDVERVMETMIAQGARLIFPQSFGYQDFALKVAERHPDVIFMHPSGYKLAKNFGTYWSASDQLFYALGVAAGRMSRTSKIGFVGAIPIPQIIGQVNAYHLGARSVNPKVTTYVLFTGSWVDPAKEAASANALVDRGVDVIANLVDSGIAVVQTAERRGVYAMGYHSAAVAKFAPRGWITGIDFHWGPLFVKIVNEVLAGTWKPAHYRPPLQEGIVRLAPFGAAVPPVVRWAVTQVVDEFKAGVRKSPWMGPVYDQQGNLRIKPGEYPGPQFINEVTWFAEGIVGQPR